MQMWNERSSPTCAGLGEYDLILGQIQTLLLRCDESLEISSLAADEVERNGSQEDETEIDKMMRIAEQKDIEVAISEKDEVNNQTRLVMRILGGFVASQTSQILKTEHCLTAFREWQRLGREAGRVWRAIAACTDPQEQQIKQRTHDDLVRKMAIVEVDLGGEVLAQWPVGWKPFGGARYRDTESTSGSDQRRIPPQNCHGFGGVWIGGGP